MRRCNRLQPLEDFDGTRHTCRVALAKHNQRRRAAKASRAAALQSSDSLGDARSAPGTAGSALTDLGTWLAELDAQITSAATAVAEAAPGGA